MRVRGVSEWSERGRTGTYFGGADGRVTRGWTEGWAGDMETDGASRFWETVPKAGRFFCAIVEL